MTPPPSKVDLAVAPSVTRCLAHGKPLTTLVTILEELAHDPGWTDGEIAELRVRVLNAFFDGPRCDDGRDG